ncbi:leucine-rich repeat-containing protein [Tanacetum coccineum]
MEHLCNECKSTGESINDKDWSTQCKGEKVLLEKKVLEVHVEKHVQNGQKRGLGKTLLESNVEYVSSVCLKWEVMSNMEVLGKIPEVLVIRINPIHLELNNFARPIPESMKRLTQLSYVDLSSNKFIGNILSFQLCKKLAHIDLSRNSLSGMIPSPYFQDLHNLISVDPSFIGFDENISSSLFSLPKLQRLQLSNNNFDGLIPHFSTASESSLNTLDLSSNKLEGEIPRSFFELGQLSVLLLSSNNLSCVIETKDF